MTALHEQPAPSLVRGVPTRIFVVLGLGGCWVAVALAETLLGGLDALPSATELAAGSGRVTSAGLLHLLGGMLLALGLIGVAGRAWATVLGRIGLLSGIALTAGLGAFGMLHLMALELPDAQLRAFDGFGAWGSPILIVLFGMTLGLPLLVAGLARSRDVPWWAVGIVVAGSLLHFFGGTELTESLSHIVFASGLLIAAVAAGRGGREPRGDR